MAPNANGAPLVKAAVRQAHAGKDQSANNNQTEKPGQGPHPGMAFLLRAACRFELVEAGQMTVQEAITGLAPAFYQLIHPACGCARDIFDRMERNHPPRPPKIKRRAA